MLRSLRLVRGLPDEEETRLLYPRATGAEHDRARADVDAVSDRLALLMDAPEPTVREAARRLVRWVAAARPSSCPRHDSLEAFFAEPMEQGPNPSEDLDRYTDLLDHQTGRRALLGEK